MLINPGLGELDYFFRSVKDYPKGSIPLVDHELASLNGINNYLLEIIHLGTPLGSFEGTYRGPSGICLVDPGGP